MSLLCRVALIGLAVGMLAGCSKPPVALSSKTLPQAVNDAFQEASPQVREVVHQAVEAFESGNFPKALAAFQELNKVRELTRRQRNLAGRCLLTVNQELRAAEARGDQGAGKFLRYQGAAK